MSTGTSIQWTDASWSPVTGCTRVSSGCDNCYSARLTHRLEKMGQQKYTGLTVLNPAGDRHFNGVVKCHDDELLKPLSWKKPRRIFVNSMSDTFHESVPFEFIDKIFAVGALCPQHTLQILTKRIERAAEYLASSTRQEKVNDSQIAINGGGNKPVDAHFGTWPLPNVWLGTSVENQKCADERIPHLLRCPAAVRFLSVEPLLGPVDLESVSHTIQPGYFGDAFHAIHRPGTPDEITKLPAYPGINWVIIGGESGPGARPCNIEWIRSIIKQCKAASVAVFCKQLGSKPYDGECRAIPFDGRCGHALGVDDGLHHLRLKDSKGGAMEEWPEDLRIRQFPKPL